MVRAVVRRAGVLVAAMALSCTARPTQVLWLVDSNVDADRTVSLSMTSMSGAQSEATLRAATAAPLGSASAAALFPSSFASVPKRGEPRSGTQTVLLRLQVAARGAQPALLVERVHQVRLSEGLPVEARVFFNVGCASRASGCTTVDEVACTASIRCLEQGLTCGDDGSCVGRELPVIPVQSFSDAAREDRPTSLDAVAMAAPDADAMPAEGPRNIAPLSTSTVTSQRPTLRVRRARADAVVRFELCRDRAMTSSCQSFEVAADEGAPASSLAAGWWFWRARTRSGESSSAPSLVWQMRVGARSATRDRAFGAQPDFNGDGRCEVVLGAPGALGGRGQVRLFEAGAGALVERSAAAAAGAAAGDRLGESVAVAGDVDGDGYVDLLVGEPGANRGTGRVRLRFGGPLGIGGRPDQAVEGRAEGERFGASLAGVGDFDGDGYGDVVIGAPDAASHGEARIMFGAASGLSSLEAVVLSGRAAGDAFGASVSSGGDLNGDGFADVLIGAPNASPGAAREAGEAHIVLGRASRSMVTSARVIDGLRAEGLFGFAVAHLGDVDGDGLSDFAVGAHNVPVASPGVGGYVAVFGGDPSLAAIGVRTRLDGDEFERHGWSIAGAFDANGDGWSDVLVGAWAAMAGRGRARWYAGGATVSAVPSADLAGGFASGAFGLSVASAGDLDGDGRDDVVVGAPANRPTSGVVGRVRVHLGAAGGLSTTAWAESSGAAPDDEFAASIARSQ